MASSANAHARWGCNRRRHARGHARVRKRHQIRRRSGNGVAGHLPLGLADDRFKLTPTAKLVGSLAVGAGLVFFLGPAGAGLPEAPLVLLSVAWFAGIVHAFNLLDNMDGLATGLGAITAASCASVLAATGASSPALLLDRPRWRAHRVSSLEYVAGTDVHG